MVNLYSGIVSLGAGVGNLQPVIKIEMGLDGKSFLGFEDWISHKCHKTK